MLTNTDDELLDLLPEDSSGEDDYLMNERLQRLILAKQVIAERIDPNDAKLKNEGGSQFKTVGGYRSNMELIDGEFAGPLI